MATITTREVAPEDAGLRARRWPISKAATPADNAGALDASAGRRARAPTATSCCSMPAAALMVAGKAQDMKDGVGHGARRRSTAARRKAKLDAARSRHRRHAS